MVQDERLASHGLRSWLKGLEMWVFAPIIAVVGGVVKPVLHPGGQQAQGDSSSVALQSQTGSVATWRRLLDTKLAGLRWRSR